MAEKPVLLLTRKLPDAVEARANRDYEAVANPDDTQFEANDLVERSAGADAILTCSTERFSAEVIEALPETVKAVATYSVGHEHIDLDAARRRGLIVTNTPDVLTAATADLTILLMLGAARRAQEWGSMLREDRWGRWVAVELLGTDITGKRLGILGMGRIGRAVAQRARGFEMEIHYHNRNRLPTELEAGVTYHATAEDMLPLCDFLSINCPATDENHHFINRERIACLPDGAIVVNSARGTIVEDDALIAALRSGKIAGIGLDVYEGEPNIDPRYRDIDTAFLMPHIGSATIETRDAMGFRALDNLDAVFAGETPRDRIA